MDRVKLQLPETLLFAVTIPVRITDINYGNHLGNDAVVAIIHEARMQMLHRHGYTELDIEGTGLIMSDLFIEFRNESFYGDHLEVAIYIGNVSRVSFELFYKISTERQEKIAVIALAKTGMVCYNYETRKVTSVPPVLRKIFDTK